MLQCLLTTAHQQSQSCLFIYYHIARVFHKYYDRFFFRKISNLYRECEHIIISVCCAIRRNLADQSTKHWKAAGPLDFLDPIGQFEWRYLMKERYAEIITVHKSEKTTNVTFLQSTPHQVMIYASVNRISIVSDNGLSPIRRQAII